MAKIIKFKRESDNLDDVELLVKPKKASKKVEKKEVVKKPEVIALDDLKVVKQYLHKAEKKEYTIEETLTRVNRRFLNSQLLQDNILNEVFKSVDNKDIKAISPQTIKVYRADKLFFCTTDTKFTYAKKTFYICSHIEKEGKDSIQFIEEEAILEGYNIRLRESSERVYRK